MIEVEPGLKRELYVELARHSLTLKAWFVDEATRFLETSRQPSLFVAEDTNSYRSQVPNGAPSSAEEDSE